MTCWQQLRSKSDFRDVTLVCDDGKMKAHKFIIIFTIFFSESETTFLQDSLCLVRFLLEN